LSLKIKTGRVVIYAGAAAITVILVFMLFAYAVIPYLASVGIKQPTETPGPKPEGFMYSGKLSVDIPIYNVYNDSTLTVTNVVAKLWHADEATLVGSKTTPDGTDDINGQVSPSDNGVLYLSVDHEATTVCYIDDARSDGASEALTALAPKDTDDDGTLEHYFKVSLDSLGPLAAGETQKVITLNLYAIEYDAPSAIVSSVNGTSADLSDTSFLDVYSTGYIDGIAAGKVFKIVKVLLDTGTTGSNETYYEDAKVEDLWISLTYGYDKTYTWSSYDYAYSGSGVATRFTFDIGVTEFTEEVYAKNVVYERNCGSTFATFTIHVKGANFDASASWIPTLYIYYITPAGTVTSINHAVAFTDS